MSQIVVADASCLIVLQNIQLLSLLQDLFGEIIITREVEAEYGSPLPDWVKIESVQDITRQTLIGLNLDLGEASSIALCLEKPDCLLIIDERKGRRIARQLNLKVVGTVGIIIRANEKGLITSLTDVRERLEKAGFYLSKSIREKLR